MEAVLTLLVAMLYLAAGIFGLYMAYRVWRCTETIAENAAKIERQLRNIGELTARTEAHAKILAATVPYIEANTRSLRDMSETG